MKMLDKIAETFVAVRPYLTRRNVTLVFAILSSFGGLVAPETLTRARNTVLMVVDLANPQTGDLL